MVNARPLVRLLPTILLAGLLAGCLTISQKGKYFSDVDGLFSYAADGRDTRVVVVGNPFSTPKAALEQRVTAAVKRAHPQVSSNFTTQPGPSALDPYKVVMVFNPVGMVTADEICAAPANVATGGPTGSHGGRLTVRAVFCGSSALSEVTASDDMPTSVDDPVLANLLLNAADQMVPPPFLDTHVTNG